MSQQPEPMTLTAFTKWYIALTKSLLFPVGLAVVIGLPLISLVKAICPNLEEEWGPMTIDLGLGALVGLFAGVLTCVVRHFRRKPDVASDRADQVARQGELRKPGE